MMRVLDELRLRGIGGLGLAQTQVARERIIAEREDKESEESQWSPIGKIMYRPTWNKVRGLRFLSVRKWRKSTKRQDVDLFFEAKYECAGTVIEAVASETYEALCMLLGNADHFGFVTVPPQAHIDNKGYFAGEVGKRLAELFGIRFVDAFTPRPRKRKSHPKDYNKRGEMKVCVDLPEEPCILFDDIASSKATLEESVRILRSNLRMVLPITWVYGVVEG
jgi:hypothetical protein